MKFFHHRRATPVISRPSQARRATGPVGGGNDQSLQAAIRLGDFFDAEYYVATYPDVADAGIRPLVHFREIGHREGRCPAASLTGLAPALVQRAQVSTTPLADIVSLLPRGYRRDLLTPRFWGTLRASVHPHFYAAQLEEGWSGGVDESLDHFLAKGAFGDMRVTMLFHPGFYRALASEELGTDVSDSHLFFHWLTVGRRNRWVPTPLFDTNYYRERHPDVQEYDGWEFVHFLQQGAFERRRRPSTFVPLNTPHGTGSKKERRPFLLDHVLAASITPEALRSSSPLEDRAMLVTEKLKHLHHPIMLEMVEKAYAIEPLIRKPYAPRDVSYPPLLNRATILRDRAEQARERIGVDHVDTIVFVPHCRMAGSARVTGALVQALSDLAPEESLLVITTDLMDFDRPDWFPPSARVVDTSSLSVGLGEENRARLLLDIVRGLQPRRVVNVNSRAAWELFRVFGRQLKSMTELYTYLFTWDLDDRGNKGGYPIRSFQECLAHLTLVLTDSTALRDELVWRYALSRELQQRLRVAHTPVDHPASIDHSRVLQRRREQGEPLRAFWSGRFDRQKRFDVVVELARQMPELEIWVWGKVVLGGADVDFDELPTNVVLHGEYHNFEDLPVEECDFLLYTSEWDGLPTILIDAGARGVAIVASSVGGVSDILTEHTGFPVLEACDAAAFRARIQQMVEDPSDVTRRAAALRDSVRDLCARSTYTAAVAEAFGVGPTAREGRRWPADNPSQVEGLHHD
jgi:glycosyltransferase involved in cell wall biosynthesis